MKSHRSHWATMPKPRALEAGALLLSMTLVACQGATTSSGPSEAAVSVAPSAAASSDASEAAAQSPSCADLSVVTGFNTSVAPLADAGFDAFRAANPDVNLTVDHVTQDRLTKTDIELAAGTAPDVIVYNQPELFDRARAGQLLALDDLIAADASFDLGSLTPAAVDSSKVDGAIYALPTDASTQVLYYNKDLFDAAGIAYPDSTWTWQTLQDNAVKMTHDDQYGHNFSWPINSGGWGQEYYYWQAGSSVVNDARTEWTAVGPEAEAALQFLVDTQLKGSTPIDSDIGFVQGNVAMMTSGQWWIPGLRTDATAFQWDIAPNPAGPGPDGDAMWATGSAYAINAATKCKDAAWAVVKWISTNPDFQKTVYGDSGLSVPALMSVGKDSWLAPSQTGQPPANAQVVLDEQVGARPVTSFPNQDKVWSFYSEAVDSVLLGKKSVAQALNDLKPLADAAIAEKAN